MFYCNLVGCFTSVLQEEDFRRFHMETKGVAANRECGETATRLPFCGSSQLAERALSLFGFTVCLFSSEHIVRTFSTELHGRNSTRITNYHSVMVTAPVYSTCHEWQFYINHLSDILWGGWLYFRVIPCTVSAVCAERRQDGWRDGAFFLL